MFEPHKASIYKWVKHFVKPHDNGARTWQQASSNCKYTYIADQMKCSARCQPIYALCNETGVSSLQRIICSLVSCKFIRVFVEQRNWNVTKWQLIVLFEFLRFGIRNYIIFCWHISQYRLINHTSLYNYETNQKDATI